MAPTPGGTRRCRGRARGARWRSAATRGVGSGPGRVPVLGAGGPRRGMMMTTGCLGGRGRAGRRGRVTPACVSTRPFRLRRGCGMGRKARGGAGAGAGMRVEGKVGRQWEQTRWPTATGGAAVAATPRRMRKGTRMPRDQPGECQGGTRAAQLAGRTERGWRRGRPPPATPRLPQMAAAPEVGMRGPRGRVARPLPPCSPVRPRGWERRATGATCSRIPRRRTRAASPRTRAWCWTCRRWCDPSRGWTSSGAASSRVRAGHCAVGSADSLYFHS